MPGLKRPVTQLMEDHGKLNQNYKTIAARIGLKCFLLSNLNKLPAVVHDAGSNPEHAEALMGLAVYINGKNGQSAGRNKVATQATNMSSLEASDDDSAEDSDSNDETKGVNEVDYENHGLQLQNLSPKKIHGSLTWTSITRS